MYEFTKIPLNCEMPKESNSKTAAKRLTKKFDSPFFFFFAPNIVCTTDLLFNPRFLGVEVQQFCLGQRWKKSLQSVSDRACQAPLLHSWSCRNNAGVLFLFFLLSHEDILKEKVILKHETMQWFTKASQSPKIMNLTRLSKVMMTRLRIHSHASSSVRFFELNANTSVLKC